MCLRATRTLVLLLPLLGTEVAAVQRTGVPLVWYAAGGASLFNMVKLNERLDRLGFAELESWAGILGLGEDLRVGRVIVGHQFTVGLWPGEVAGGRQTTLTTVYWRIHAGVDILPHAVRSLELFPLVGTGAGVIALTINPETRAFDQLLQAPAPAKPIGQIHYLVSVGAGLDYTARLPFPFPAPTLGARVGFVLQVTDYDDWWRNGTRLGDGPKQRLNSLYLMGVVGIRRWMKWRRRRCGESR